MTQRTFTRRRALKLGAASALAAPFVKTARADSKVVVGSWGGPYTDAQAEAFFKPFEAATGIKVEIFTAGNFTAAGIKAAVETGHYEWDWTTLGGAESTNAARGGWLEPVDYNIVDKSKLTQDRQAFEFGVGAEVTSDVIAYRTDVFPDGGPQNWADYWDTEKFPGPRSMYKNPWPLLEAALLADGVAPADLYPLDLDRAFAKADAIKEHVTVWWESGSQSQDAIISKNAVISALWNGRAGMSARDGAPVATSWGQAFYDPAMFTVPKGTPNREAAMRLTDWCAQPEGQARFAELTFYGPTNAAAIDLIDEAIRPNINTHPDNLAKSVARDFDWWADNLAAVNERFVAWLIT